MSTDKKAPDQGKSSLVEELAQVLPKDIKFTVHHISTPPTITEPLCYAPAFVPGTEQTAPRSRKPLKTYCEKHFLTVSIHANEAHEQVIAFGLEIYIYTTAHSSIIFVAKADSTGYLGLLNLPKGTPSPIREVSVTFIQYLVANRTRKGIQFIVNLFARSQSQYLFPGSVKNNGKHILDDRGLVRWWCRVLNPLLEQESSAKKSWDRVHGYLIIPGMDEYETRAYLPRTPSTSQHWDVGHPLQRISPYISDPVTYGASIPIRCLIPTYPDDPKARFVEELEESTPERAKLVNGWRSPLTLNQFWEMMSFRQECSSGRLTGFIWLVYDPPSQGMERRRGSSRSAAAFIQTPSASFNENSMSAPQPGAIDIGLGLLTSSPSTQTEPSEAVGPKPKVKAKKPRKRVLTGPIIPRPPRAKTQQRAHFPKETETAYYYWPDEGRGQVVLGESGYKRATELLLHLEFATLEHAVASTSRWTREVNVGQPWGLDMVGQRQAPADSSAGIANSGNMAAIDLSKTDLIKRKRPIANVAPDCAAAKASEVNTLGAGLVRKKQKTS